MKTIKTLIFLIIVIAAALVGYAWSGHYDVSVGTGHNSVTTWLLETLRERSIETRVAKLSVPGNLGDEERIRAGAGHYGDMCAGCHGYPGKQPTENFDPAPPALYRDAEDPAEAFWVVKNGIKMSAMPRHPDHSDADIWDIVAFLQRLPQLNVDEYEALTAAAGDHQHEEGERAGAAQSSALPADPAGAVEAFHQALQKGDGAAALALLHANATILEGGHLQTKAEYAEHHLEADIGFLAQTAAEQLSRDERTGNRQATITTRSRLTGTIDGESVDSELEEVMTLARSDAGWQITHIQWSEAGEQAAE